MPILLSVYELEDKGLASCDAYAAVIENRITVEQARSAFDEMLLDAKRAATSIGNEMGYCTNAGVVARKFQRTQCFGILLNAAYYAQLNKAGAYA